MGMLTLYGPILGRKIVYISHGGTCMKMRHKEEVLEIEGLQHLQCQHEEADTLLAFHANNISNGNILVSSSDTDVLIILLGLSGRSEGMTTIYPRLWIWQPLEIHCCSCNS